MRIDRTTVQGTSRLIERGSRRTRRSRIAQRPRLEPLEQRLTLSTYFVATTGSDSNPGSSSAPFATLQHSMVALHPGDTLDVEAGNYAGFISGWDATPASGGDAYGYIDGTAGAPITIQAAPGTTAGSVVINQKNDGDARLASTWSPAITTSPSPD